jgi:hypothetical protein
MHSAAGQYHFFKKNIKNIENVLSSLSLAVMADPSELDLAAMLDSHLGLQMLADPRLVLATMPDPCALV